MSDLLFDPETVVVLKEPDHSIAEPIIVTKNVETRLRNTLASLFAGDTNTEASRRAMRDVVSDFLKSNEVFKTDDTRNFEVVHVAKTKNHLVFDIRFMMAPQSRALVDTEHEFLDRLAGAIVKMRLLTSLPGIVPSAIEDAFERACAALGVDAKTRLEEVVAIEKVVAKPLPRLMRVAATLIDVLTSDDSWLTDYVWKDREQSFEDFVAELVMSATADTESTLGMLGCSVTLDHTIESEKRVLVSGLTAYAIRMGADPNGGVQVTRLTRLVERAQRLMPRDDGEDDSPPRDAG